VHRGSVRQVSTLRGKQIFVLNSPLRLSPVHYRKFAYGVRLMHRVYRG